MPRREDTGFTPPSASNGDPIPLRQVRQDMLQQMVNDLKIGLLDTSSWKMARSRTEKTRLLDGATFDTIIVAWGGSKWTDFFEFTDEALFNRYRNMLIPRQSVMLTDEEVAVVQAHREGALPRITGKRTRKT
jgi:hypothetical protein